MKKIIADKKFRQEAVTVMTALVLVLLIGIWGLLDRPDRWIEDAMFQHPKALDGTIIVIGIDDKALEEIGPYNTWDRSVMASALEQLAKDPSNRPAVVAIDTQYTGETGTEADTKLADAAASLDNVIIASFASIGPAVVEDENGNIYFDQNAVYDYSVPYKALRDVTAQAHINGMTDSDGIMRHAMLTVTPNGQKVYSMAYTAAKLYAEKTGIAIKEPETSGGSFYVSYSALPGGYNDGLSIVDLINGEIPSDVFADRIVYIGPYAVGLQDTFFTSIDHGRQMYGVEYQANVTQMILDGDYKKEAGKGIQRLILFIVCAIVGVTQVYIGKRGEVAA